MHLRKSEEAEAVESGDDYCIIDILDGNIEISKNTCENAVSSAVGVSLSETEPPGSESCSLSVSSSSTSSAVADSRKGFGAGIKKRQNDIRTVCSESFVQYKRNEVHYHVMETDFCPP